MMKFVYFLALLTFSLSSSIFLNEQWTSGFLNIDEENKLFYVLFKSRANLSKPPLVFWFQGGPGCSGLSNALTENGPFVIAPDLTLISSLYSWNNNADVVYVDFPLGTGFSNCKNSSRIPATREELIKDFRAFLVNFMNKHKEYSGNDLYLTGHSYGTRFALMFAKDIIDNKFKSLTLKGIALGNGWLKPGSMMRSYIDFSNENNIKQHPISSFGSTLAFNLSAIFVDIGMHRYAHTLRFFGMSIFNGLHLRMNFYDIRKKCVLQPTCYDTSRLVGFMSRSDVLRELNVGNNKWVNCSKEVSDQLIANEMYTDITETLEQLLNNPEPIKIVIYNGNKDWLCNTKGFYSTLSQLKWKQKNDFDTANWNPWLVSGKLAGKYKESGNFRVYEVYDAGHLVTYDQPEFTYDIITELISS